MKDKRVSLLWIVTLLFAFVSLVPVITYAELSDQTNVGLSGYLTSELEVDKSIATMDLYNLTVYRISANPEWFASKPHPYDAALIQYFLDNCAYDVIIDRNHLYPPGAASDADAVTNWATVNSSIFDVLATWPNNTRVAVELINEYTNSDYYSRMQTLITDIRDSGYNNTIVCNKWSQAWQPLTDALNATWQGYHYYFNYWSPTSARNDVQAALNLGIKIVNTEIGAHTDESGSFTESLVAELQEFLQWSYDNEVSNCIWQREDVDNWDKYIELGLDLSFIETAPFVPDPDDPPTPDPDPGDERPPVVDPPETTPQIGTFVSGGDVQFYLMNSSSFGFASDRSGILITVSTGLLNGTLNKLNILKHKGSFYINSEDAATFIVTGYSTESRTVIPSLAGASNAEMINKTQLNATCAVGETLRFSWGTELTPLLPFMFIFGMAGIIMFFGGFAYGAHQIKEDEYKEGFFTIIIFCSLGFGLIIAWLGF